MAKTARIKRKLMAEQWDQFARAALNGLPAIQKQEMRRAFYAGARAILFGVIDVWRPGEKHFSIPPTVRRLIDGYFRGEHYTFDSAGRLHVLPASSVWFTYRTHETSMGIYVSEIIPVRDNLPMESA